MTTLMTNGDKYNKGDLVFAKVKGFSPWPARIEKISNSGCSSRYEVLFFGTHQTSVCKAGEIVPFEENKEKLGNKKQHGFVAAMEEIKHFPRVQPTASETIEDHASLGHVTDTQRAPRKRSASLPSNDIDEQTKETTPVEIKSDASDVNSVSSNEDVKKSPSKSIKKTSSLIGKTPIVRLRQEPMETDEDYFVAWETDDNDENLEPTGYPHTEPSEGDDESRLFQEITTSIANETPIRTEDDYSISSGSICSFVEENLLMTMMNARPTRTQSVEEKLRFLKTEQKLIKTDKILKRYLGRANSTNIDGALSVLRDLLSTEFNALVLKKQPLFVDTIYKLCRYVGPADRTRITSQDQVDDTLALIRENASMLFKKIESYFCIPEDADFCEWFKREAKQLRMLVPSGDRFVMLTQELTALEIGPEDHFCALEDEDE